MTFNSKLSLALMAAGFSASFSAYASAACVTGDCSAMGYTKTESACSGDVIRCPFDTSKVFCQETCEASNCVRCEAGSSKSCAVCKDGYELLCAKDLQGNIISCGCNKIPTCSVEHCKTCETGSSTSCAVCYPIYERFKQLNGNYTCEERVVPDPIIVPSNCSRSEISVTCGGKEYCCGQPTTCDAITNKPLKACYTTADTANVKVDPM